MTRQEQEAAEQAAYEEHMQAVYDEQNWMRQITEQVEQLQNEVTLLRAENRKLRDVLEWVNNQCPGKCSGVCDAALRGEHRREEEA